MSLLRDKSWRVVSKIWVSLRGDSDSTINSLTWVEEGWKWFVLKSKGSDEREFSSLRVIFPLFSPCTLSTKPNLYVRGISLEQKVGWFVSHVNPGSLVHVELHPSFELVFPSSHSASNISPSPQVSWQIPSLSGSLYPTLQTHWLLTEIWKRLGSQKRHCTPEEVLWAFLHVLKPRAAKSSQTRLISVIRH